MVGARSGVEIDVTQKRIRVYKALGKWRMGRWLELSPFDHVRLKMTYESQVMNARSISNTHTVKTYDLIFRGPSGEEFEFHDFSTYKLAHRAMSVLVQELGYSFEDEVALRKKRARSSNMDRRR